QMRLPCGGYPWGGIGPKRRSWSKFSLDDAAALEDSEAHHPGFHFANNPDLGNATQNRSRLAN
ncbi:MAG TPA: hypothetical protein DCS88_13585, partial [Alphaproteobacteria bacterium]|nr:hypothetical protein [Alphaproteobacteria bacterium]